jgi:hypothetical protein
MDSNKRSIAIASLIVLLMGVNFSRLNGSNCIRPIHIITLLTMGAAVGVLLMNIILLLKSKKK